MSTPTPLLDRPDALEPLPCGTPTAADSPPIAGGVGDRLLRAPVPGSRRRPARQWSVLPALPVAHHQLLRGPRRRWWRPLLCLLLLVPMIAVGTALALLPTALVGLLAGVDGLGRWMQLDALDAPVAPSTGGLLYLLLSLAALIPAATLSTWAVHRVRPGFLSSVAGRLRWRWLLGCTLVVVPIYAVFLTVVTLMPGDLGTRPADWVALLVISVLLSPLQAAGEEYVFRGWLMQNVAACFRRARVGLVVGTAVSAAAFALAHGSLDPWILIILITMSVAHSYLTWRTGGLEAAVVVHAVNNVGVGIVGLTVGGYAESFVGAGTRATPVDAGISLLVLAVTVGALLLLARRLHPARTYAAPAELARPVEC